MARSQFVLSENFFSTFLLVTVCSVVHFTVSFDVTVPERRVVGVRGQPVVLGCSYTADPGESLDMLVVTWQRQEDDQVLHSFYHSRDQLDRQSPNYGNRTSLYHSRLPAGNASLRLERVGPQDSGRYLCSVSSLQGVGKAEVQLEFAAFYTEPRLSIVVLPSSVSLQFQSEGYPAPQVQWVDAAGQKLEAQEELAGPGEDGLFSLRTNVTVEDPGRGLNLSFTLTNSALGQQLQRPVSFRLDPGVLGQSTVGMTVTIVVLALLCLMLCLVLAAIVYFRRRRSAEMKPQTDSSQTSPFA